LDVPSRRLVLHVGDEEIATRAADWKPPTVPGADRGYLRLFVEHVQQADRGADLDFLVGSSGAPVGKQAF
ncbi:MAG: dihydroxy-acid dehydratase, partial [Acidimicrobiales bacterium]